MKPHKTINFNNPNFDCIICLGGNFAEVEVFSHYSTATIIAADSGYFNLERHDITPHYLVGDLDSINTDLIAKLKTQISVHHIAEQETNDFEKAVKLATQLGKKNLLIVGMNGGLLEHTLNNWSVFAKLSNSHNLTIYELGRFCISVDCDVEFETKIDEVVSLIPQPKSVISSKGLLWELDYYELAIGGQEGARNKAVSKKVELTVHSGEILLCANSNF